ncbi:MAG: 4-(cytidine 5'-diphospho)-2-C-methyl-D-erythritol kinase, partial [Clostridia bacterium]|nr:4-(cytidine 5'-diphospho)-2-C-methyl-D-erythritol kinase [Clostridia bacterium]
MKIKAFAKVNLSLDVTGKRADGYHTLCSVFQSVSLCDIVEIEKSDSISVKCSDTSLNGEDNLCNTAAVKFFQAAGILGGADIFIEKHIPLAAGLGGGSADAGAVLKGLNELYGNPLSEKKLLEIALSLGADVPFCMVGGTKLCEGIGEIMTELSPLPECYIVIAKKG